MSADSPIPIWSRYRATSGAWSRRTRTQRHGGAERAGPLEANRRSSRRSIILSASDSSPTLICSLRVLLGGFRVSLLFRPRRTEVVYHIKVSFMTGKLVDRALNLSHGKLRFPGSRERGRIFHGELINDGFRV